MFALYANHNLITRRRTYKECMEAAMMIGMAYFNSRTGRNVLKKNVDIDRVH